MNLLWGGELLCAYNGAHLIGTLSLIERKKFNLKYASHDNLAVSSNYKGIGVASALFKKALDIAIKKNWAFLNSFTATNAISSVRYHLKMGFVIYGKSFGQGYNSYSFIYPLKRFMAIRYVGVRFPIYLGITILNFLKKTTIKYD